MVPGSARNWIAVNASSTIQPQHKLNRKKQHQAKEGQNQKENKHL
jgi:hypothetical protein